MGPMSNFKQRAARLTIGLGLAATMALSAVMPALAAPGTGTGTAQITGGATTATVAGFAFDDEFTAVPGTPDGVKLTGADQVATATPVVTVVDATGTASGWSVTMKLSNTFSDGGSNQFTAAPTVTGTTIRNSANALVTPTGSGIGNISSTTAATIAGVAAATPGGTYTVTPTIQIAIPQDTKVATYTGTLTVDTAPVIQ